MYKRYIDDLIFIWNNTEEEFHRFTEFLNSNDWGLTLSGEINDTNINYLDIALFHENDNILTTNFFNKVDSNSKSQKELL